MRHKWIPAGTYTYTCTNPGCRLEMQRPARYRLIGTIGSYKEGYLPCPTSAASVAAPATDRVSTLREILVIVEEVRKSHSSMSKDAVESVRFVLDGVKAAVEQKLVLCAHEASASSTADEDDPI